jgi:tRNA (guanine37-N1)-methyltransferase
MTFRATVFTLYPEMFPGTLGQSLAGEALRKGLWALDTTQIREHGLGAHRVVDDTPAGCCAAMYWRAPSTPESRRMTRGHGC